MKFLGLFVFALATYSALVSANDVLDLGDSDFNTRVSETETTLVMFYAPWCGKFISNILIFASIKLFFFCLTLNLLFA